MKSLKEIRAEVRHSEELATRKIRRMAKQDGGYDVRGTSLDPLKPKGWIDRATRAQLDKYQRELTQFRRPSVGWVRGGNGKPIRRQVVRNAELAARRRNKAVETVESRIADIPIPWAGAGVTAGSVSAERNKPGGTKILKINDEMGVRLKTPVRIKPKNYSSEQAVMSRAALNNRYLSKTGVQLQIGRARSNVMAMIDRSPSMESLRDEFKSLSDEQFWFAWSASPHLARSLAIMYDLELRGNVEAWNDVYEQEIEEVSGIIAQVKGINIAPGTFWAR